MKLISLFIFILATNLMAEGILHSNGIYCIVGDGCYYDNNHVSLFDEKNYTAHKSVSEIVPITIIPTRFGNIKL